MTDMIPTSSTPNTSSGWGNHFGNRFYVDTEITVGSFVWYRSVAGDNTPDYLQVWNVDTASRIAEIAPTPGAATGWVSQNLIAALNLIPGVNYMVAGIASNATARAWSTSPPAVNSPFHLVGVRFGGTRDQLPASVSSFELLALSLSTSGAVPGTGGSDGSTNTGTPTYSGDLEAWLSSSGTANLHQSDGLPWLTKEETALIKDAVNLIKAAGSGNTIDWIQALWNLSGDFATGQIGWLKNFLGHRDQLIDPTGASGGGGSAFYGPSGTQVAAGVETLLASALSPTDLGTALALQRERLTLSPDLADTSRWSQVDSVDGTDVVHCYTGADVYVVTATSLPAHQPAEDLGGGVIWTPHLGWWAAERNGAVGPRRFLEFATSLCHDNGLYMGALVVKSYNPGVGITIDAYVLDR